MRVYDTRHQRRLVAAVEIVSPANRDRPEARRFFAARCAALLRQHVSVAIVDVVTTRQFNLYGDLLELIGQADPSLAPEPPPLYASACRWRRVDDSWQLETWAHAFAVPPELEASCEEACRILRIP